MGASQETCFYSDEAKDALPSSLVKYITRYGEQGDDALADVMIIGEVQIIELALGQKGAVDIRFFLWQNRVNTALNIMQNMHHRRDHITAVIVHPPAFAGLVSGIILPRLYVEKLLKRPSEWERNLLPVGVVCTRKV